MERFNCCGQKDYHHDYKCCDKKDYHHKNWDKKSHNNYRKDQADFADFEYYTLDPNVSVPNRQELPTNVQTSVASITLDQVKKGNVVWLNGVLGLDNDANNERQMIVRIYKGNPPIFTPGNEIYRSIIEIDNEFNDDQTVEPFAHVDAIQNFDRNVTYTVTVEPSGNNVFLNGPVTFTGALIKK